MPSAFQNQYSSSHSSSNGLNFSEYGWGKCVGWGLCDDKGQLIWVWLSRWQTFRAFWLTGESHCFSHGLREGYYHRNSWDRKEGTPFHFVLWENGQRGDTTGNSRTCHWWLELGCGQLKVALVSYLLYLWKYRWLFLVLYQKGLRNIAWQSLWGWTFILIIWGRVLHLWFPKSVLSLFRVKIQLGYDNSLQILRSGFPAILGGEMVNNLTSDPSMYNYFYNYCLNKIYIFSSKCITSRWKIIFWNLRYFKSLHISKWEAKTFLQIQAITRILKKTHFRRLISFWGLFAQCVMTRGLKAFKVVVF